jgi:hypothetical protein
VLKIPSSNGFADQCGIAVGDLALANESTGQCNTAVGSRALLYDNSGVFNTAVGSWRSKMTTGETPIQPLGTGPCLEARDPPHTALKS